MMRVHGMTLSGNCYKVRLTLEQLGLRYEWTEVDVVAGETRTEAFRALNPAGQVPVLELAPGHVLTQSNAIMCYLADGTDLLPDDRLERARVLEWLFFEQYNHEPCIAVARFLVRFSGRPEAEIREQVQRLHGRGYAALDVMEQHLGAHDYLAAGRYTLADIGLYAYTHCAADGGFELSRYPAITAWLERVRAQPGHVPMAGGAGGARR